MNMSNRWVLKYERPEPDGPASCFIGIGCCGALAGLLLLIPTVLAVLR